jgi:hypothetical protein
LLTFADAPYLFGADAIADCKLAAVEMPSVTQLPHLAHIVSVSTLAGLPSPRLKQPLAWCSARLRMHKWIISGHMLRQSLSQLCR